MKKDRFKSLYVEVIFTIIAFAIMVMLSYTFNSNTVRVNLARNAESVLSFTHQRIESELVASRMMLGVFRHTVSQLISDGNVEMLPNYIRLVSEYAMSKESGIQNTNGLYGYFEGIYDRPAFLNGINWTAPENYHPEKEIWYISARENCGKITETKPYIDAFTGNYIITYACCIHDDDDNYMAVVCIDVQLEKIGRIVTSTTLNEGGYGVLTAPDLTVIAHTNPEFIGKRLNGLLIPISSYSEEIRQGEELYEETMKNWRGEEVIAFSRSLPNDWHLVLLTPKAQYYTGTTEMFIVLCILGLIMMTVLITVLVRIDKAKAKADADSKQKSTFLANMSHEMRTPLNTIMGMAAIGIEEEELKAKNYALEKIDEASAHLLGVINDVLDMSKIEAGKLELILSDACFEQVLKKAINAVDFNIEQKGLEFYVTVDGAIPPLLITDEQRLAQVIINLLSNAVKFTPEKGVIRLNAYLTDDTEDICTVTVEIIDTGIGITPEQQKRVFSAFEQAESGKSRRFGGTGLGLGISKRLVEMMGGSISVTSQIDKGSNFTFNFKAKRSDQKPVSLLDENIRWENISILVVDDSAEVLSYFSHILDRYGVTCDVALSGKEAIKLIENTGGYDMYFIDWKMPEMDGIELTRKIRSTDLKRKSVVIMISSTEWTVIRERAEQVGVDKYLMKPLFASDVMNCMNSCMSKTDEQTPRHKKIMKLGELTGCTILLAEDVEINREILLNRMKYTGAKIDCVQNGAEALQTLIENPDKYDLVFMDVQMPVMDGLEATRKIRESGSKLPIIAMTANVFKEDIDQCLNAGMNDHIGKPLDLDIVLNKIHKYMH
ncbi:MAG: response regulator [Oscillospiraceae bacterium]|nr:response regulator [Oscillospiraceae bacterium]